MKTNIQLRLATLGAAILLASGCQYLPFFGPSVEGPEVVNPEYENGVLTTREPVSVPEAVEATARALRMLEIQVQQVDPGAGVVTGRTLDEKDVRVELEPEQGSTRLRVSILPGGIEARERMILDQIRRELPS